MRVMNSGHKEVRKCHTGKRSREISGNLPRLIAAHCVWASRSAASLCSGGGFEGAHRGRGAQEGRTYSQRTQLEAQHARSRGAPLAHVVLDLRGAQATAGEHEMGCAWWARAGQGWRMGSSGRVSRSMAAASPANGREQGCEAEGVGGRRARGRIAWRERCGSGGFREQQASRRSMRAARGGR